MEKASRIIRGQEQVAYSSADFPFYLRRSTFSHYCPALRHACHWHDDLEFLYTEKGHIDYSVDGVIHHLREGDSIFANARRMHYGFSPDGTDCTFVTMLIHPLLFAQSASMVERCVRPLTENAAFPARVLTPESAQWGRALSLLREIAEREAINRFTTAEVKVDMTGMNNTIHSDMDIDGFITVFTDRFAEALTATAEGVHV